MQKISSAFFYRLLIIVLFFGFGTDLNSLYPPIRVELVERHTPITILPALPPRPSFWGGFGEGFGQGLSSALKEYFDEKQRQRELQAVEESWARMKQFEHKLAITRNQMQVQLESKKRKKAQKEYLSKIESISFNQDKVVGIALIDPLIIPLIKKNFEYN